MKENLAKGLLCILLVASVTFVGLVAMVITAFIGRGAFYTPFILVLGLGLVAVIALRLFSPIRRGLLRTIVLCFLGVAMLAAVGYEINRAYHNSIPRVNEQGVDLELYKPFAPDSRAARLEEASALRLEENLPRLDGATALYPLYAAFAQAVYPERDYPVYAMKEDVPPGWGEVACSTTPDAYGRLMRGETDMIFVAQPSRQQLEEAQSLGITLKLTPIGKEAFVFFVNAENPVKGLSTQQIQDIYAGNITNWQQLGGANKAIRAFQRPQDSGSQTMLQKLMEGRELMSPPREDVVSGMGDIIERTADYRNYSNAIGYSFLFFATEMIQNNQVKLLEVDGVKPERSTISSGEYPLAADFYVVTAGTGNPNVERFIQWIRSPQGQYLVEKTGYTPIGD